MSFFALGLGVLLVLDTFSTVSSEDIFINPWQLRAPNMPYENLNATINDTITFFWDDDENHTVYINPTGNCDDTGSLLIGDSSPASYTFTETDALNTTLGDPVFFADNLAQLCEWGMRFSVDVFEAPSASPTTFPSEEPTIAPTLSPSSTPTTSPSEQPTTSTPSSTPTETLSEQPTTSSPSSTPTETHSEQPTTSTPSSTPSLVPSSTPSDHPSGVPSGQPTPAPTDLASKAPTTAPVLTRAPTGAPTATPTKSPTTAPVAPDVPTEPPSGGEVEPPTSSEGERVSNTIEGLRMGMAGITEMSPSAETEWQELTASFSSSFVFNDLKDKVSNFVTTYEVTGVSPITVQQGRQLQLRANGNSRHQRSLQEQGIVVEYTQTVEYNTVDLSEFTPEFLVTAPFATQAERTAYVTLLKTTSTTDLANIKGVSETQLPVTPPPTSAPAQKDAILTLPAIIGIACGGAGLLILILLFAIYCRKGSDVGGDAKSADEPPLHVDVKEDEVSTLAGPNGPPTYGDQSVATMDYDYSKAYGGAGDTSVSSAGGTFGSNTQNLSLPANAAATGAALGVMGDDDESYNTKYDDPRAAQGMEEVIHIFAPPGKLGVVIDTPDDGAPVVHAVKDTSVIADRIIVGDKLVAVDDEDVRSMTAIKVSKMISRKGANPSRKLTVVRTVPLE
ncbi:unnamed protein product [Pseudo-nitzschia multistriata]|uniref:PDZ domain-containing protein n=1 Tax=Pseudo-nitzschia multistriata TaxID=183589 RepID=A0A448ZB67_9STRA|nr:unnamed protein product [Pseudo-nitzschia multistriata]